MNKQLIAGGAIAGGAIAGGAYLARRRLSERRWVRLRAAIERMPDEAPPKWMFNNITAIRENTERILQVVESERASAER